MKLVGVLSVLLFTLFSAPVFANEVEQECETLYKHAVGELEFLFSEDVTTDDIDPEKMFSIYSKMSNASEKCGPHNTEFYDVRAIMCKYYLQGYGTEYSEEKAFPHCESALKRGNLVAMVSAFIGHIDSSSKPDVNYKKALEYLDIWAAHNEGYDLGHHIFEASIYRRGGSGVEKNEKKAFEIIEKLAQLDEETAVQAKCDLSIHYREGIGIEKNEAEADKWLTAYKKQRPDEDCKLIDIGAMLKKN